MDILLETTIESTGEKLVISHWCSPEAAPRKFRDYILSSIGASNPHSGLYSLNGWRGYFSDAMAGRFYPEIVDHWFFAEVDGECAARMWFAYSNSTLRGNFGNVLTEPQFRQRGIMTVLLKFFASEFQKSPVEMLCCASGNPYAVKSYLKTGFELPYGGETGVLCIRKNGTFLEETAKVFRKDSKVTLVRPGNIGDQFDFDKFLAYTPELKHRSIPFRKGPAAAVSEFRLAYQEMLGGRAVVYSALNSSQDRVGYAFGIVSDGGMALFDFVIHPAYFSGASQLIRTTLDGFREKFDRELCYCGIADDTEKLDLLKEFISEKYVIPGALPEDMIVCKLK